MSLLATWEKAQPAIKTQVGPTTYETWFSSIHITEKNSETLLIETPDEFFKNWIIEHYSQTISDHLGKISGVPVHLEFSVNTGLLKEGTQKQFSEFEKNFEEKKNDETNLNPRFSFNNFVVGPSNRFAAAASQAVAESPAKAYNPLFIYGQVGLGKTHLMQAVTHQIEKIHPNLKICYTTSERFTNELIEAIRHRSTTQFRQKYRTIDVLLIDDIHFIAGKESTQEEFFHTFNALHNSRKQIIISSDRPPKEIANLEERLSSRFAWGLIADIQPPDYETRVAILRKKSERELVSVPDNVICFIAEQIKTNIRELEGALIRVVAYSLLEEKPVTLELAKAVLKDMVKESVKIISVEMIQRKVAEHFKITVADIKAKRRNRNVILPRQIAMYLTRKLTGLSLPEIGGAFGGKDHTTVLHSFKKIDAEAITDKSLQRTLEELVTEIQQ